MRSLLLAILVLFSVACNASDPIDRLVKTLDPHSIWTNGIFQPVALPAFASPQQVVAECLRRAQIDKYTIVEVRDVTISSLKYSAVLVNSSLGRKIVLLQYSEPAKGWWNRTYDAK